MIKTAIRSAILDSVYDVTSYGGGESIPNSEDALFWLDGTISGDEFIDKSGNNRNFTITDKDFSDDWNKGFPYKSVATISAPVGDATLIAADVNNFLYASDETPNAIPVASFFQNIDYENKLFSRHISQGLNANDIETTEPAVRDIVLYNAAQSDSDLTAATNYYGVPEMDVSGIWCSPDGNDTTGEGSKATPYLTLSKAVDEAGVGGQVYVKTGSYDLEATYITIRSYVYATGYTEFINQPSDYWFILNGAYIQGFNFVKTAGYCLYVSSSVTNTIDRCYFEDFGIVVLQGGGTGELIFKNCGFDMDLASAIEAFRFNGQNATIQNSYIKCDSPSYDMRLGYASAGQNITIKHNKINALTTTFMYAIVNTNSVIMKDNQILNCGNISAAAGVLVFTSIDYSYNIGVQTKSPLNVIAATVTTLSVHHNEIIVTSASRVIATINADTVNVYNNIFNIDGDGGVMSFIPTTSMVLNIYNNRLVSSGESVSVTIHDGTVSDVITGGFYNNYLEQTNATASNTHGIQIYNQAGFNCYHNYIKAANNLLGLVYKGDDYDYSNTYCNYNVLVHSIILLKGAENLTVVGNTIYHEVGAEYGSISLITNSIGDAETNTFKNNLFINESDAAANLAIINFANDVNIASQVFNYNLYYGLNIAVASVDTTDYNWSGWQAEGFETNGDELNLSEKNNLFTNLSNLDFSLASGSAAINAGDSLSATYDDGLDSSTDWGDENTVPSIVTKQQTGDWDIGAYIQ